MKARTWREKAGAFQGNSAFHVRYPVKACGGVASPDAGRSIPDGVGASHAEVHLGVRPHCRLSGGAGSSLSLTEAALSLSLNPQPLAPHSTRYQLLHLCSVEAVRTEVLGERLPLLLQRGPADAEVHSISQAGERPGPRRQPQIRWHSRGSVKVAVGQSKATHPPSSTKSLALSRQRPQCGGRALSDGHLASRSWRQALHLPPCPPPPHTRRCEGV